MEKRSWDGTYGMWNNAWSELHAQTTTWRTIEILIFCYFETLFTVILNCSLLVYYCLITSLLKHLLPSSLFGSNFQLPPFCPLFSLLSIIATYVFSVPIKAIFRQPKEDVGGYYDLSSLPIPMKTIFSLLWCRPCPIFVRPLVTWWIPHIFPLNPTPDWSMSVLSLSFRLLLNISDAVAQIFENHRLLPCWSVVAILFYPGGSYHPQTF